MPQKLSLCIGPTSNANRRTLALKGFKFQYLSLKTNLGPWGTNEYITFPYIGYIDFMHDQFEVSLKAIFVCMIYRGIFLFVLNIIRITHDAW